MKVIYRIQEKYHIKRHSNRLLSEMFLSSYKKAENYLHNKFVNSDVDCHKAYIKGRFLHLRDSIYAPNGYFTSWDIDFIPVN